MAEPGKEGRNLDLPNKISLGALPVLYFIVRSMPVTTLSWGSVVSNMNVRYTLFCYRPKV